MRCIRCGSAVVTEQLERTAQGCRRIFCRSCEKQVNERTGAALNRPHYLTDVIALIVLWRLREARPARSARDVRRARHDTQRRRRARVAGRTLPALGEALRRRRHGKRGRRRWADDTHIKIEGRWRPVHHVVGSTGVLVDAPFSEHDAPCRSLAMLGFLDAASRHAPAMLPRARDDACQREPWTEPCMPLRSAAASSYAACSCSTVGASPATVVRRMSRTWLASKRRTRCIVWRLSHITKS